MTLLAGAACAEIETLLAPHLAEGRRLVRITRRPSPNRSSFIVDDIDAHLDDGSSMALVAKAVQWEALGAEARKAKPAFLWNADRERLTYEALLSRTTLNTARCFGAYVDQDDVGYLVLERVEGIPLWQCDRFDAWRHAAAWLAALHTQVSADLARRSDAGPHLLFYDRAFFARWLARARAFQTTSAAEMALLAGYHAVAADRLLALPPTFIHGEFYAANVLVGDSDSGRETAVRPVDWETAGIGPGVVDLACLLAGQWTDDERADIADIYFGELAGRGSVVPSRDRYLMDLDLCLIHLSIRNLGWSRDWVPPADRTYDWLGEALRLGEKWQL